MTTASAQTTRPLADTSDLLISEIFGPTLQGEGPNAGRRCSFIRLATCNLHCTWCDTPYTWDWRRFEIADQIHHMPALAVVDAITAHSTRRVVITGGEPLLQQGRTSWPTLMHHLRSRGYTVEVETNGTVTPTPETIASVGHFNVSPKLAHAGDHENMRIRRHALTELRRAGGHFKFVVRGGHWREDMAEVAELVATIGIPSDRVWIMPEGTDAAIVADSLRWLAEPVIERGWNLTNRLHVTIWGDDRGH